MAAEAILMSRVLVFGSDRKALTPEFTMNIDRGWMLTGNPAVAGGGNTEIILRADQVSQKCWQFGNVLYVPHAKLPAWAGVLDTPWNAALPVRAVCYNAEYLLSLRAPDEPIMIEGTLDQIIERMLEMFNAEQDWYVRLGNVSGVDTTSRQETFDLRNYWEQLKALLERSGCEMQTRAEIDSNKHLIIYLDIARQIGVDTGFLYVDGKTGNATFREPVQNGMIRNRVRGWGDESGATSRLRTDVFRNEDSIRLYGVRSENVQFRVTSEQSTLDLYTQTYLDYSAFPRFGFLVDVLDRGAAWSHLRLGNIARFHFSRAYLPAGVQGWKGKARILALAYSEAGGVVTAKCEEVL